jgi:hypothetical protein
MEFNITQLNEVKSKFDPTTFDKTDSVAMEESHDPQSSRAAKEKLDLMIKNASTKITNNEGIEELKALLQDIGRVNLDLHG